MPIYINGRFLSRPVTGVERFALMIVRALDETSAAFTTGPWTILAPPGVERPQGLRNIRFENVGTRGGHLWEQTELLAASRKGILVSLCNSGPFLHRRQLVVLHDAWVYRYPEHFSRAYGLFHRTLGRLISKTATIATVSRFSRSELCQILGLAPEKVAVIGNAADHTGETEADLSVIERFDLASRPFFLFVGSPAPNKNLARAVIAFRELNRPDTAFVLVGSAAKSFADGAIGEIPANVVRTGRLTDAEIKALYANAAALVFPSIYEGFGIPPLEAMISGCPTLAADIPAVREVCGDAAVYFDPFDISSITIAMRKVAEGNIDREAIIAAGFQRAGEYSWKKSAEALAACVHSISEKAGKRRRPT